MALDLEKEITKLEKYLVKQGREALIRELRGLKNDDRRQRLMKQAVYEQEIMDTKANDQKLQAAKDELKELNSVYNENLRMNKKISRFIHLLIEESGKV